MYHIICLMQETVFLLRLNKYIFTSLYTFNSNSNFLPYLSISLAMLGKDFEYFVDYLYRLSCKMRNYYKTIFTWVYSIVLVFSMSLDFFHRLIQGYEEAVCLS